MLANSTPHTDVSAQNNGRVLSTAEFDSSGFVRLSTRLSLTTLEIAESLGTVLSLEGIAKVQSLVPRHAEEVEKNRYSGLYGTHAFPLHTDLAHWHIPPRYFLLRCVEPAENVPTNFVHSSDVLAFEADSILKRALFRPRRRQDGRLTCLRLRERECFRWDPTFLEPINTLAIELRARILDRIAKVPRRSIAFAAAGECVVVDNWKTLHSRAEVPSDGMHRKLERVYLETLRL